MRPLTIIVAMTPYGVIGYQGKIPWRCPEDMARFKQLTTGHAIVMGRKTYESIGRPLPNRTNIIVTRQEGFTIPAPAATDVTAPQPAPTTVCTSFEDALQTAYAVDASPFVIGGRAIYELALPLATKLEITYVLRNGVPGDVHFPTFPPGVHYPDVMTWRSTDKRQAWDAKGERSLADIEFHTFERRQTT